MPPQTSSPVYANFPSEKLTIAAGVCIFHLATERVVLCYHSRDKYWFLPKGRKNANETIERTAEREGFEESGYRNRLLPLPMKHRQPDPDTGHPDFVTDPVWTQFLPLTASSQYLLFWYVAETVPPEVERNYAVSVSRDDNASSMPLYRPPPMFPENITLKERIAMDQVVDESGQRKVYAPVRISGTAQDEEEILYESHLLPIDEARRKLRRSVMEDVIGRGWEAVQLRLQMEDKRAKAESLTQQT